MGRCEWARTAKSVAYHDHEWGVPQHDDRVLFEFLVLEGAQAGLSWETVLNKRAHYCEVFDRFDPAKVAGYGQEKVAALLADPGIIRNRLKVHSAVTNARSFLTVQEELGAFDRYLWGFVGGEPVQNRWLRLDEIPAETEVSRALSRDLKQRGFHFVGPTICYALMQAVGLVNDHMVDCPRWSALGGTRLR